MGLKRKLGLAPSLPRAPALAGADVLPNAAAAAVPAPMVPILSTRRMKARQFPKAEAAREARRIVELAEGAARAAKEADDEARRAIEQLSGQEQQAVSAAEEAAASHLEAEKEVARAYKAAKAAAQELQASQAHVCFVDGCGERFGSAAALTRHQNRAHRFPTKPEGKAASPKARGKKRRR